LSFDLARTLRRLKPSKLTTRLARRRAEDLPFIGAVPLPGPELLLDTTVYIDSLQDRSPRVLDALMEMRICNHSAICLAELTHAFGRLPPNHPTTANTLDRITQAIEAIPTHRLREPSASAWGAAGVLAGLAFRLGGYQTGQERRLLNDALLYLQALEDGQVVLTGNTGDFDILQQLVPEGRVLLYPRGNG
jgi:predicted nucleic acid-binding protein